MRIIIINILYNTKRAELSKIDKFFRPLPYFAKLNMLKIKFSILNILSSYIIYKQIKLNTSIVLSKNIYRIFLKIFCGL